MAPMLHEINAETIAQAIGEIARARGLSDDHIQDDTLVVIRWAQTGDGDGILALGRVVVRLFQPPAAPPGDPLAARISHPKAPALDALAVAIMAARGRCRLARDECIEPRELAALLCVDESWVRSLVRSKKLKRVGRGPRDPISLASAEAYLRRGKVSPWCRIDESEPLLAGRDPA